MNRFFSLQGILSLFALLSISAYAQERCGSQAKLHQYLIEYPEYQESRELLEEQIEDWIENNSQNRSGGIITIPVVVHVVYKTQIQNISYEQIVSQIEVLNKDYRRLNTDASNTPSQFSSVAADIGIEFCLASEDPNGNWTDGITRTETSTNSWNGSDLVKSTANGGKDGWNPVKYLNIWVCNIGGGYLGYAYPPGVSPNLDGVVIGYKYFGTFGTVQSPYNKGRTTTHEVGHWLNLEHLWGLGQSNSNCSADDNVSDTPKQSGPNYDCPSFPHISCSNGNNGDMFMNYMDYTDDDCMNLFTEGQKQRMLAVMDGARVGIQSNPTVSCNSVSINENVQESNIKLYPNPANDILNVEVGRSFDVLRYRLFNALGTLVQEGNLDGVATIDISKLTSGVYFIEIQSGMDKMTEKIMISR